MRSVDDDGSAEGAQGPQILLVNRDLPMNLILVLERALALIAEGIGGVAVGEVEVGGETVVTDGDPGQHPIRPTLHVHHALRPPAATLGHILDLQEVIPPTPQVRLIVDQVDHAVDLGHLIHRILLGAITHLEVGLAQGRRPTVTALPEDAAVAEDTVRSPALILVTLQSFPTVAFDKVPIDRLAQPRMPLFPSVNQGTSLMVLLNKNSC